MAGRQHSKVVILGSGPAGYTAAIYAARAGMDPILVRGAEPGGQLMITTDVENYPGFAEVIQGPWLMEQMAGQIAKLGTRVAEDSVVRVELRQRPFVCVGDSGEHYLGDTLVIATGAQARWLGLDSETRLRGHGVSGCATCDGFFFRGRPVAVVGGGNTAVEEALFLTNFATKVTLIHRRESLRAEKILQDRLFRHPKIEVVWNSAVEEILGGGEPAQVRAVRIKNLHSGAPSELGVEGVFIAIGHVPNTGLFKGQLEIDSDGYILTRPGTAQTSVPGVFAAGDVQDKIYRQAVTAAGTGCMAAIEADKFIAAHESAVAAE